MHPDMLILAKRFVVALESISQDVRNMSAYLYDLSYSVQNFLDEKREKEIISQVSSDEYDNSSSATPPAEQETSAGNECSFKYEQVEERSLPDLHNQEHEEISSQDVACMDIENSDALPSFTEPATEEAFRGEENDNSCDPLDTYRDDTTNVRGVIEEINLEPYVEYIAASSTHCSSIDVGGSALASCSTEDDSVGQEKAIDRHPLDVRGEEHVAGMEMEQCMGKNGTSDDGTQEKAQGPTSLHSSCNRTKSGSQSRAFECPVCRKMFQTKSSLSTHLLVHADEKPYKCMLCEKSFTQSSRLTEHVRSHTGEKPFKCNQCGKKFNRSDYLTSHMRTHTGEKPYKCSQCGKAFGNKSNLNSHMITHSSDLIYTCPDCRLCFNSLRDFTCHKRVSHADTSSSS